MARNLTDPNNDNILEWTERVTDADGDNLAVSLELDAVDDGGGFAQKDQDSSQVPWLSYSTRTNVLQDGTREVLMDIEAESTALQTGYVYRFEVVADDGITTSSRTFTLSIKEATTFEGTRIFISAGADVYQYDLSTAWDIGSKTQQGKHDFSDTNIDQSSLYFKPDGRKVFLADVAGSKIYSVNVPTAWDISSVRSGSTDVITSFSTGSFIPSGLYFREDGKLMFWVGKDSNGNVAVAKAELSTAWDLTTASKVQDAQIDSSGNYLGLSFKPDGTKLFVTKTNGDSDLISDTLSTAWDLSTLSGSLTTNAGIIDDYSPDALQIGKRGEKAFVAGSGNGSVEEFILSTPYDITTASLNQKNTFAGYAGLFLGNQP